MSLHHFVVVLHVLGACLTVGVSMITLALVWRQSVTAPSVAFIERLREFGIYGLLWQLLTGIHLFSTQFRDLSDNWTFWTKLGLVAVDTFAAQKLLSQRLKEVSAGTRPTPSSGLSVTALWSTVLLVGVVFLGVVLLLRE